MKSFRDPEALRERPDITFREETERVDPAASANVRADLAALDSHVVVGVTNDADEVLLMDDGEHGWTLAAVPVEAGDDWLAAGRNGVAGLTDVRVAVDRAERVRRADYHVGDEVDPHATVYTVVVRGESVTGRPVASDPTIAGEPIPDVGWFDAVPEGVDGPVADDIRQFLA